MNQTKKSKNSPIVLTVEREFLGKYPVEEVVKRMIKTHINRCNLSKALH